jgi:hypothetical protein
MSDNLTALAMQAEAIDSELQATTPQAIIEGQAVTQTMDANQQNAEGVAFGLSLALTVLAPIFPSLEGVYPEAVRNQVAQSLAPVLTKYNVNLADIGGNWKEEIGAAIVCVPIALATYKAIRHDLDAKEQKPEEKPVSPEVV